MMYLYATVSTRLAKETTQMTKFLTRAIVVLAALAAFGCASTTNRRETADTGRLNSSDGTPQGVSLCLPPGLTHEKIRSWAMVSGTPSAVVAHDGGPDVPVLIMVYDAGGRRAMIAWTLSTPVTAIYYDSDIEDKGAAAYTNTQWVKDKMALREPAGPCAWKNTSAVPA